MRKLMDHQEDALEYLRGRSSGALFMEMRLGKTLTMIRWAQEAWPGGLILVVAPLTVLGAWQEELDEEGELWVDVEGDNVDAREANVLESARVAERCGKRVWFLIGYDRLRATFRLTVIPWTAVILDESTRIRNPQAMITRVCNGGTHNRVRYVGFDHVPHRYVLSGLPAPESALDFYEQMRFVKPNFLGVGNFFEFRAKLWQPGQMPGEWNPQRGALSRVKSAVAKHAHVVRRADVGITCERVYETRRITMPPALRRASKTLEEDFAWGDRSTRWRIVVQTWLAELAGGFSPEGKFMSAHKLKELVNLLLGELRREQTVVWFRYIPEMERAAEVLAKAGVSFKRIHGGVPAVNRTGILREFRAGRFQALLIQIQCGRYGLDCSSADTAIYYSNSYSWEDRAQSEDRIFHPRKTVPLLYVDLVSRNSADEDVVRALRGKRVTAASFMMFVRQFYRARCGHEAEDGR